MVKEKVKTLLKTLKYPSAWQVRPKLDKSNTIVISYHFFNQGNSIFGNGKSLKQGGALQIDIFSLVDYTNTVKEVKDLLISNNFRFYEMYDDIETLDNQQIYHKVILFNYDESEVN